RAIMAEMGFKSVAETVRRTDMLEFADFSNPWKARYVDLSAVLHMPELRSGDTRPDTQKQDHGLENALDQTQLIKLAEPALEGGEKVRAELEVKNTNRTVGATLSGLIARKHGFVGLPDD